MVLVPSIRNLILSSIRNGQQCQHIEKEKKTRSPTNMLSPSGFHKLKSESIVGDLGKDLLQAKKFDIVKRGNVSHQQRSNDSTPVQSPIKIPSKTPMKRNVNTDLEDNVEEENKPKTITMNCGMIKFQDIIIPPSAPTDLICEECEKSIAVLSCNRCKQLFCMNCAESCHPKPYGKEHHPHEEDGNIRAVQFGDVSRIQPKNEFILPDTEIHEEEYILYKDITKPQALTTSKIIHKQSNLSYQAPKYDALQIVLFIDPHTEKEAYGKIISQWDQRHGTFATPAIIRSDNTIVCYIIQLLGYTKNITNIAILLPKNNKIEKINNYPIIDKIEIDEMIEHRYNAHIIKKRIANINNIQKLGPKHHLRDIGNYENNKNKILLENREYNINSNNIKYKNNDIINSEIYNNSMNDDDSICNTIASSTISNRNIICNNNRKIRLGTNNEYITVNKRKSYPTDLYDAVDLNVYANIDTDVQSQVSVDNILNSPFPAYYRSYEDILVPTTTSSNSSSSICIDNDDNSSSNSIYSHNTTSTTTNTTSTTNNIHHNNHNNTTAVQKNKNKNININQAFKQIATRTGKYINTSECDIHNIYQNNNDRINTTTTNTSNGNNIHNSHNTIHTTTANTTDNNIYTKQALQILILKETEICSIQERIALKIKRKNDLLMKVWEKLSGSERVFMKKYGFYRWQGMYFMGFSDFL